ncbi:unnamed protein product [Spirodela intermedia]|uniref:Zinc-ribbon 15 domain-containing protein n=1 Tax=Spirodela intermedia TaxID=51605 RepID=A0A7I8J0Q5_SPIIN|nr:unnamed protein product [Spirodela intermedia]CAA6663814.1 unnamed protein product [Spirodela intermedia]
MFFFFVGGVEQQVARVLKEGAGRCFACGSQADLVEVEKVLKLFFVPVWRWPGKDPAMRCENCCSIFPSSFSLPPAGATGEESSAAAASSACRRCSSATPATARWSAASVSAPSAAPPCRNCISLPPRGARKGLGFGKKSCDLLSNVDTHTVALSIR